MQDPKIVIGLIVIVLAIAYTSLDLPPPDISGLLD